MDDLERIRFEKEKWVGKNGVADLPLVKGHSNKEIKVLYTPDDLKEVDYLKDISFPGEFPFTRGIYPGMYRKGPWQMRLYSGYGAAEDTNKRWRFLLERGNMGVGCAFDLPTQMGLDSDDPLAEDEVGIVGVAIDTLQDMEILYEEIPIHKVVSSFNINAPAIILLAMYCALGEKKEVPHLN